jgi:hypothetical protein
MSSKGQRDTGRALGSSGAYDVVRFEGSVGGGGFRTRFRAPQLLRRCNSFTRFHKDFGARRCRDAGVFAR